MTTVNEEEFDTMAKIDWQWINAMYAALTRLAPDKETLLAEIERIAKDANASGKDNG